MSQTHAQIDLAVTDGAMGSGDGSARALEPTFAVAPDGMDARDARRGRQFASAWPELLGLLQGTLELARRLAETTKGDVQRDLLREIRMGAEGGIALCERALDVAQPRDGSELPETKLAAPRSAFGSSERGEAATDEAHADLRSVVSHGALPPAPAVRSSRERAVPVERDEVPGSWGARRVLVIEDDPVNQRVALLMLERLGCQADVVGSGAEAIDLLAEARHDLVFMDMEMPGMDGFEATRRIRAAERESGRRRARIIALTSGGTLELRGRGSDAGMDDFLTKPVDSAALSSAIDGAASRPPSGHERGGAAGPVIDLALIDRLRALVDGDQNTLADLVHDFVASADQQWLDLRASFDLGDHERARRLAHTLKSSAAMFGATQVSRCCRALEPSMVEPGAEERLCELADAWCAARAALSQLAETLLER